MLRCDKVLIVGNFNIHICCPKKPLVKDSLDLVDSFNLFQSVHSSSEEHVHTLNLVVSVINLEIGDAVFSDLF